MAISNWTSIIEGQSGQTVSDAFDNAFGNIDVEIDKIEAVGGITDRLTDLETSEVIQDGRLDDLESPDSLQFTPLLVHPVHSEGQVFYDGNEGTFRAQGPIPGVDVAVGHGMHVHVVNNTGAIILKGEALRHDGVAAGIPQVAKAIATSFDEARVWGVAAADIAIGADGALQTFGEIINVDTSTLPTGVPLYLSDTVAGAWTDVAPDIVSRIGGALTTDAITGRLFVDTINNKSLPTVLAGLKNHTPGDEIYPVTTVPQDINNYLIEETIVSLANPLTGELTQPNDGKYRANFTATLSFDSAITTRNVTIEFYDVTGAVVEFEYVTNIPRDATTDSLSFSYPFTCLADRVYKARIKANTAIDITFDSVSFDIESVNIS